MDSQTGALAIVGWFATCRRGWNWASTASSVVSQMRTVRGAAMTDVFRAAMQEISVAGHARSSHDDAGPTSWAITDPLSRMRATAVTVANRPSVSAGAHLGSEDLHLISFIQSPAASGSPLPRPHDRSWFVATEWTSPGRTSAVRAVHRRRPCASPGRSTARSRHRWCRQYERSHESGTLNAL